MTSLEMRFVRTASSFFHAVVTSFSLKLFNCINMESLVYWISLWPQLDKRPCREHYLHNLTRKIWWIQLATTSELINLYPSLGAGQGVDKHYKWHIDVISMIWECWYTSQSSIWIKKLHFNTTSKNIDSSVLKIITSNKQDIASWMMWKWRDKQQQETYSASNTLHEVSKVEFLATRCMCPH